MPYRIQIKLLQKLCYDIFVIFESPESAHPFHEYIYVFQTPEHNLPC